MPSTVPTALASDSRESLSDSGLESLSASRRLTELRQGDRGRLLPSELPASDLDLLRALGLGRRSAFRLCQAGSPWIVQVRGTRIGLADEVARRLRVLCDETGAPGPAADTAAADTADGR